MTKRDFCERAGGGHEKISAEAAVAPAYAARGLHKHSESFILHFYSVLLELFHLNCKGGKDGGLKKLKPAYVSREQ